MQFHNYLFRQCTGAWKTTWDTLFPLGNAIREYVHLTNMRKAVPYWWTMKNTTLFFFYVRELCSSLPRVEQFLPSHQTRQLKSTETSYCLFLPCHVNLILSVPPLTTHLKLIRGEMSYLIIFNHEHWSVACNFNFRAVCPKSFLKRAKRYPEIHWSLYYLSLWEDTLGGNNCTSGKLRLIYYETICERWTVSKERSSKQQSSAHCMFFFQLS